ncbi:MAG: penicillin-binding protein 1A [Gammaproteobacteria bacterium]
MKKAKKAIKIIGSTLLSLSILFVGTVLLLYIYMEFGLPSVDVLKDARLQVPLQIYSADNKLIAEYGKKKRIPVRYNEIPTPLVEAVLATEDRRFFEHPGVDIRGLSRAVVNLITTGKKSQGGSTITMQVARNFFLTSKKTYTRKFKEILLAIKIDRELSKEKILELYFNKIFLGNRAYGFGAAARVYYGKSLAELTLPQYAMLAGLPKAPSRLNPLANPNAAMKRRNYVLRRMYEENFITSQEYQSAIRAPITATYHRLRISVNAPFVAELIRQKLVNIYGNKAYTMGFKVYTTIDSEDQQSADDAVNHALFAYKQRHPSKSQPKPQGALVAMNPQTGAVYALVGGADFGKNKFDHITQAKRQVGSSFKPFVYAAALDKGLTLATVINDSPVVMDDSGEKMLWRPENHTKKFYGPTRLREGLVHSLNLVSIRILRQISIPYTLDYLEKFGFDKNTLPSTLSLALGTAQMTPMQVAAGYAVFANGGYHVKPYMVNRIVQGENHIVYQAEPKTICQMDEMNDGQCAARVMSAQTAYLMTSALQDVVKHGTGRAALALKRTDLAGKTGTTDEQYDAWFAGFNQRMVTVAWMGYDMPKSLHEYGAQAALPMWIEFMRQALADTPTAAMAQPDNIVTAKIDPKTGLLVPAGQQHFIYEYFRKGELPKAESVTHTASYNDMTQSEHSDDASLQDLY